MFKIESILFCISSKTIQVVEVKESLLPTARDALVN